MEILQLPLYFNNREYIAYSQDGFFCHSDFTSVIHTHDYPEVHLQTGGRMVYEIGGDRFDLSAGTFLLVPAGSYHRMVSCTEDSRHLAFQINAGASPVSLRQIPAECAKEIERLIPENRKPDHRTASLCAWLSLLGSYLFENAGVHDPRAFSKVDNREMLIRDFFSQNYPKQIRLSDLAERLNLCEKQTQRAVIRVLGTTFGKALTAYRLEAAKRLVEAGMPLTEAAEKVGFRSYGGFRKAVKVAEERERNQKRTIIDK